MMVTYSDTQVIAAIEAAPAPIKDFIRDGSMAIAVAGIGQKHALHIDTIGKLAETTRNMLVGLVSPVDAASALGALGLSGEVSKSVLAELNQQVFKPLQEKMRSAPTPPVPQQQETAAAETWVQVTPPAAQPSVEQRVEPPLPPSPPPPPNLPTEQPMAPIKPPVAGPAPAPQPEPTISVAPESEPLTHPHARTMAEDMELAKAGIYVHHEEPSAKPSVQPAAPARPTVSAFPQPSSPEQPRSAPPAPHTPPPGPPQGRPIIKSYAVDPYREPID